MKHRDGSLASKTVSTMFSEGFIQKTWTPLLGTVLQFHKVDYSKESAKHSGLFVFEA